MWTTAAQQETSIPSSFLPPEPNTLKEMEKMDPKDEEREGSRGGREKQSTPNTPGWDHSHHWSNLGLRGGEECKIGCEIQAVQWIILSLMFQKLRVSGMLQELPEML